MSSTSQPSILAAAPAHGRSILFRLQFESDPRPALRRLRSGFSLEWGVIGLGTPLVAALGADVPGLRPFPAFAGPAAVVPSTQHELWFMARGTDRTEVFDRAAAVTELLAPEIVLEDAMETFTYAGGRDLTGYIDGTANPSAEESPAVALAGDGSSFAGVQRWVHDLNRFRAHAPEERDLIFGRRISDNEEIADAPAFAHVKRAEQETHGFLVRRSMPWSTGDKQGLEFVAFGRSLDVFESVLRRMAGVDDTVTDGLFRFTRPVAGGY